MAIAFVFPGQGSQAVGMGKALASNFTPAKQIFEEVDGALGSKLSTIIFEGPADTLTLTENAQPALMAVSLAVVRVLEAEAGLNLARDTQFVAGHSLGEYSALAAAGAFTVADAARLLRTRGQAMQKAVPVGVGAMAALIGLEFDAAAAAKARSRAGRSLPGGERQRRRPSGCFGKQGSRRTRGRNRKNKGRKACDAVACVRTLPLRLDAAGRRCDG